MTSNQWARHINDTLPLAGASLPFSGADLPLADGILINGNNLYNAIIRLDLVLKLHDLDGK